MILLKNKITLCTYLLIASFFLSLNISCTEKIAGSEVTNEDAVCLVGKVLDQRGQGVSNIIARLDKIRLADTTDNNGNYSLKLSKQEISDLKINLDTLNDTVKIISSGNVASSINITKWIDTLPSVYLIQRNIYGQLNTKDTDFKRIEAVISILDEENHIISNFTKELWFNNGTKGYSGFSYFPKNSRNQKYSVYVKVFNGDSIYTGKSEVVYFNDLAGDIEIPSFNYNFNPELQVFAGNDTALSINDTIRLSANATGNSSSIIKKWEWNINGNGFKQTAGGDTTIILPDSETIILCIVKTTDTLGNIALDSITIDCKNDIPTIHFEAPTIVSSNAEVTIKAVAFDLGKIIKWEWNLNNVSYVHSDSNNVSYITFITPSSFKNIPCNIKVTDDDGNIVQQTCSIPIGTWVYQEKLSTFPYNQAFIENYNNNFYKICGNLIGDNYEISLKNSNGLDWENMGTPSLIPIDIIKYSYVQMDLNISNTGEIFAVLFINDSLYTFKYQNDSLAIIGRFPASDHNCKQICSSVSQDGSFYFATISGPAPKKYIDLYQFKKGNWIKIPTNNLDSGDITKISLQNSDNDIYLGGNIRNSKHFLYKYDGYTISMLTIGLYQALDRFFVTCYNDNVYVCGNYTGVTGNPLYFLKKYNKGTWYDLDSQLDLGCIASLNIYNNEILLGIFKSGRYSELNYLYNYSLHSVEQIGGFITNDEFYATDNMRIFIDSENRFYAALNNGIFKLQ